MFRETESILVVVQVWEGEGRGMGNYCSQVHFWGVMTMI